MQRRIRNGQQSAFRLCRIGREDRRGHIEAIDVATRRLRQFRQPGKRRPQSLIAVKPRNLFNLGIGTDNLTHTESHKRLVASLEIINLTNKVALYNFLSTFSGTHFVAPRTLQAKIGFVF